MKKQPKREHQIQEQIAKLLLQTGHLVIRQNSGVSYENGRYTAFYRILTEKIIDDYGDEVTNTTIRKRHSPTKGLADLVAYSNGNAFFVEVKSKKGRLTEEQWMFAKLCKLHKMDYIVAMDVETVQQYIATGIVPELPKETIKRNTLTLKDLKERLT